ncbi:MAG: hypothetical protein RIC55_26605 [Pirellulaceae bacterium]
MIRPIATTLVCLFACLGCDSEQSTAEQRLDVLDAEIGSAVVMALPGVDHFDHHSASTNPPTHRVIHICDWHFVSFDDYAADLRSQEASLTAAEIDASYTDFLGQVERVQVEQMDLLRELIKHHGVERVFVEGLTEPDMPVFDARIQAMRKMEAELPEIRRRRDAALGEMARLEQAGKRDGKAYELETQLVAAIDGLLEQHRLDVLRIGAAGHLYLAGELSAVEPLDDAHALAAAKPEVVNGDLQLDTALEMREDAQVRRMIERGPYAVAILGGGHDLADNVERVTNRRSEYVRIFTARYVEIATDAHPATSEN